MAFKKAIKEQSKLRLAIDGLAGTGKTWTSLAIAATLGALIRQSQQGDGRVAVIDSERGSARLYADRFDFDVDELDTFSPLAYVDKIREAEREGYDIIIADSISHAWSGKGGALEQKDSASMRGGNSYTAWREVTPKQNQFIDAMIGCKAHFIATMRTKMEYVQDKDEHGKTQIRRVGLAAVQRDGIEYEFTLVGDMDHSHAMKIAKSRIDTIAVGAQFDRPGEAFARQLYTWLMSGSAPRAVERRPDPMLDVIHAIELAGTLQELEFLVPQLRSLPPAVLADARRRYGERKARLQAEAMSGLFGTEATTEEPPP